MSTYLSFNPDYVLKPDNGRTLIMARMVDRDLIKGVDDGFSTHIHPVFAMMLCFLDGRSEKECVESISHHLSVGENEVKVFLNKLTDNPNYVVVKSAKGESCFPPFTIKSHEQRQVRNRYEPDLFSYTDLDLRVKRHKTPSTITFMLNNYCVTDCIYCYEDRSIVRGTGVSLKRITELIQEAKKLFVRNFDVIGGEFFLYPHWKELLKELHLNEYIPYLSTKIPISEDIITFLAQLEKQDLQVSLDSLIGEHLVPSIRVKQDYVNKMKNSLTLLNHNKIKVLVHTVLTKYNGHLEDMASIFNFIKSMDNIAEWKIVKADRSIYTRTPYTEFKIGENNLREVLEYIEEIKGISTFPIICTAKLTPTSVTIQNNDLHTFLRRNFCSGNYCSIYILPTGDVTICEQLYWNKTFFLGNVNEQSIEEIWNSEKATSLFNLEQAKIPQDSLCHSCKDYKECRSLRQVCYRDIIAKHGRSKWYYPDVNCPKQHLKIEGAV